MAEDHRTTDTDGSSALVGTGTDVGKRARPQTVTDVKDAVGSVENCHQPISARRHVATGEVADLAQKEKKVEVADLAQQTKQQEMHTEKTKKQTTIWGGDARMDAACLSNVEIDAVLTPALGQKYVWPSAALHDVSTGDATITELRMKADSTDGYAVLFVRKHWVAARLRTATKSIEVWDSARSACVQRDLHRVACALGRTLVQHECPQQNRGTNECGLFAVAFVLLLNQGQLIPERNAKVSLAQLRDAWPSAEGMTALAQRAFGMRAQIVDRRSETALSLASESNNIKQVRTRATTDKLEALGNQMAARNSAEWEKFSTPLERCPDLNEVYMSVCRIAARKAWKDTLAVNAGTIAEHLINTPHLADVMQNEQRMTALVSATREQLRSTVSAGAPKRQPATLDKCVDVGRASLSATQKLSTPQGMCPDVNKAGATVRDRQDDVETVPSVAFTEPLSSVDAPKHLNFGAKPWAPTAQHGGTSTVSGGAPKRQPTLDKWVGARPAPETETRAVDPFAHLYTEPLRSTGQAKTRADLNEMLARHAAHESALLLRKDTVVPSAAPASTLKAAAAQPFTPFAQRSDDTQPPVLQHTADKASAPTVTPPAEGTVPQSGKVAVKPGAHVRASDNQLLQAGARLNSAAGSVNLCFALVGQALVNGLFHSGETENLAIPRLTQRATALKLRKAGLSPKARNEQRDVGEFLQALDMRVTIYSPNENQELCLSEATPAPVYYNGAEHLLRQPYRFLVGGAEGDLPGIITFHTVADSKEAAARKANVISGRAARMVFGAQFLGQRSKLGTVDVGAMQGHFVLTQQPSTAVYAVYEATGDTAPYSFTACLVTVPNSAGAHLPPAARRFIGRCAHDSASAPQGVLCSHRIADPLTDAELLGLPAEENSWLAITAQPATAAIVAPDRSEHAQATAVSADPVAPAKPTTYTHSPYGRAETTGRTSSFDYHFQRHASAPTKPTFSEEEEMAVLQHRASINNRELGRAWGAQPAPGTAASAATPQQAGPGREKGQWASTPTSIPYRDVVAARQATVVTALPPPARPLDFLQVRRLMQQVAIGQAVRIAWSTKAGERGVWRGRVKRRPTSHLPGLTDYLWSLCDCGQWAALEGFADTETPFPGVVYHSFELESEALMDVGLAPDQHTRCRCSEFRRRPVTVGAPLPPDEAEEDDKQLNRSQKMAAKHPRPHTQQEQAATDPGGTEKATIQPTLVTNTILTKIMRGMKHNSKIQLSGITGGGLSSSADLQEEQFVWLGQLLRQGQAFAVRVVRERCHRCDNWMDMEDEDLEVELPQPGVSYYKVEPWVGPWPQDECDCDVSEEGDIDEENDNDIADPTDLEEFYRELAADVSLGFMSKGHNERAAPDIARMRGGDAAKWFLFPDRPPHVHGLVWKQLAKATRASHRRWLECLKGMPYALHSVPFGTAVVELIVRRAIAKKWKASTLSSALSACASALRQLPLYTNVAVGINLAQDPAFAAACKRAQHLARVTKRFGVLTSMTKATLHAIEGRAKDPVARLFLQLAWSFAARLGDLRQVRAGDIQMTAGAAGRVGIAITFRYGKGAAFWGPWTAHTVVAAETAKALTALRIAVPQGPLFAPKHQAWISSAVKAYGLDVRSIRRGSLQHLASLGASDEQLRLLSGHKRMDTLLRYLGWGRFSQSQDANRDENSFENCFYLGSCMCATVLCTG